MRSWPRSYSNVARGLSVWVLDERDKNKMFGEELQGPESAEVGP
jgi:hypothetical protein